MHFYFLFLYLSRKYYFLKKFRPYATLTIGLAKKLREIGQKLAEIVWRYAEVLRRNMHVFQYEKCTFATILFSVIKKTVRNLRRTGR